MKNNLFTTSSFHTWNKKTILFILIAFVSTAFIGHDDGNQTRSNNSLQTSIVIGKGNELSALKFNTFGANTRSLAGSEAGWIYKISANGRLYRSLSSKQDWKQMSFAKTNLRKVTVVGEIPYVTDVNNNIFKFENLRFSLIQGKAKDIQGTADGTLYIISRKAWLPAGTSGDEHWGIFRYNASTRRWRKVSRNGITPVQFGASATSIMYTDQNMKMYTITPIGQGTFPGLAKSIAGNGKNELFVVGSSSRLFKWSNSVKNWEVLPNTRNDLVEVAVAGELAFVRTQAGRVYKVATRPHESNLFIPTRAIRQGIQASLNAPLLGMDPSPSNHKIYPIVTIIWDPHRPRVTPLNRRRAEEIIFRGDNTVKTYFQEVSAGKVTIRNIATLGPYDAQLPYEHYWENTGNLSTSWRNPHHRKYMEAVSMASRDFNFKKYDTNNDGVLAPTELGIVLLVPDNRPGGGGWERGINLTEIPSKPLIVNGVRTTRLVEIRVDQNKTRVVGTIAHELMHLLFKAKDMYWPCKYPHAAGAFSLMDHHQQSTHLDPLHKLKMGWLKPQVAESDGLYLLSATTAGLKNEALILINPKRSLKEYFILEVRKKERLDQHLPDEGLAIWRIQADPGKLSRTRNPRGVDRECFQEVLRDFGRTGIQLIQPVFTGGGPVSFSTALWDGADNRTGYDILATSRDPNKVTLKWADGTPTGIEIRNISKADRTMSFYVKFPHDW